MIKEEIKRKPIWIIWGMIFGLIGFILNILNIISMNLLSLRFLPLDIFPKPLLTSFLSGFGRGPILAVTYMILFFIEVIIYWAVIGGILGIIFKKIKSAKIKRIIGITLILVVLVYFAMSLSYERIRIVPGGEEGSAVQEEKEIIGLGGGACVYEQDYEKVCKLSYQEDCLGARYNFYEGLLCTAKELGTACMRTINKMEIEGKNFFQDSCGNQANSYDLSKKDDKDYWTNLKVD